MSATWIGAIAEHWHLETLPNHLNQIILAFCIYESIFLLLSPLLARALVPKIYSSFNRRTQINWHVRVVSTVQSVYINTAALWVLKESTTPSDAPAQRIWAYDPGIGSVQAFAAGYFLWDTLVSVQCYNVLGAGSLVHAVTALTITVMGFRPFANYYGLRFVLYELSTPFLNIHWFLDKIGKTGSTLQLVNGLTLISTFFACRLVWGFYQTGRFFADAWAVWDAGQKPDLAEKHGSSESVPAWLLAVYLVGNTVLCGLNTYWFGLMVRALLKRFTKDEKQKDS